ncbi:MAG: CHAT domain-containing protein [Symploca sp. SIO2C1]|nr:CHAT domain-containing protein [Symploca sp. SIO2C1]
MQSSPTEIQDNLQTQADSLLKQGIEQYQASQLTLAIESWQQALSLYQQLQDQQKEALVTELLGLAHQALGDYNQAIAYYQQHLTLARIIKNREYEANALGNLGNSYRVLGKYSQSLDYHQQSLAIRVELQDRKGEGQVLANIGNVQAILGNDQQAIELHLKSLAIAKSVGNLRGSAISLNSLGVLFANQENYQQATQYYQQYLATVRSINNPASEGKALNNLGSIYHMQGKLETAFSYYQESLALAQTINNPRLEAAALGGLGLVYANQGNYSQAIEYQEKSWKLTQAIGDGRMEGIALQNLGHTFWLSGDLTKAEEKLRAALEIVESMRLNLEDADKVSIFDTHWQVLTYNLLQQILIAQNQPEAALEIAERGRARAFVELLAQGLSSASLAKLRTESLQVNIAPPTISQIRQIAQAQNATLVQYAIIPDDRFIAQGKLKGTNLELFIWVIQPSGKVSFRRVELTSLNTSLQDLVSTSREAIGVRSRATIQIELATDVSQTERLQQLYQLLIEPIAELLPTQPESQVIFVPHNELFLVPFPALQDPSGKYLIEKHTILTAPAIQILDFTRQQRQQLEAEYSEPIQGEGVLVVGNPTMPILRDGDKIEQLVPLLGAEKEALAIATLLNTKPFIGDKATKVEIVEQMPQARLIHLATHGLLDDIKDLGIPGAIALAPSRGDEGFLTAGEILDLKLKAELVVLSACDTGRGTITGDGVIGLSRSLIAAGVPSAIVSLWAVPDAPTALLMTEFYRNLQQNPDKAQALRQAMLATMEQHPDPRDWAAFTLIGEAE